MDFFDVVKNRHSYRGTFKDISVPINDIVKIVKAGLWAPSGKNKQTTEFIILNEKSAVKRINDMHKNNKAVQQAKAFILCIIDKNPVNIIGNESFQIEDCAAAVENMLLAITALGYASVWIDGWLRFDDNSMKIGKIVCLPENKKLQIILPIGVPTEHGKQPEKKQFDERVCFDRYDF